MNVIFNLPHSISQREFIDKEFEKFLYFIRCFKIISLLFVLKKYHIIDQFFDFLWDFKRKTSQNFHNRYINNPLPWFQLPERLLITKEKQIFLNLNDLSNILKNLNKFAYIILLLNFLHHLSNFILFQKHIKCHFFFSCQIIFNFLNLLVSLFAGVCVFVDGFDVLG